ncbi:MAG: TatD family hydrolase [Bacillota bacterium]|nr:TatD family hydrolase [Bacillota bacterium]
MKMIDAHIHLDQYSDKEIAMILDDANRIEALISVSFNLSSCERNLQLLKKYAKVYGAFGYHPEQRLPSDSEKNDLFQWICSNFDEMIAVGEVGLPYYLRKDGKITRNQFEEHIELLNLFIQKAKKWEKPIILHAVYDDAPIVCDYLENYSIQKAHFHWFKGDLKTCERMIKNGYYISVTPDIVYEEEIQKIVKIYPIDQMMIETDGPWPFEGPFTGKMTHPNMMADSINMIARIKNLTVNEVGNRLLENTKHFYQL